MIDDPLFPLPGLTSVLRVVSTHAPVYIASVPFIERTESIVPTADAGPVAIGYGPRSGVLVVFYRLRPDEDASMAEEKKPAWDPSVVAEQLRAEWRAGKKITEIHVFMPPSEIKGFPKQLQVRTGARVIFHCVIAPSGDEFDKVIEDAFRANPDLLTRVNEDPALWEVVIRTVGLETVEAIFLIDHPGLRPDGQEGAPCSGS